METDNSIITDLLEKDAPSNLLRIPLPRDPIRRTGFLIFVEFPILFPQPFTSTDRGTPFTVPIGSVFGNLLALILGGPGTIVVGTILARKTRLLADTRAAAIAGTEEFLSSLRKVAGLSSPSQSKRGGLARPFPLLPSLVSRISYLEKFSSMA